MEVLVGDLIGFIERRGGQGVVSETIELSRHAVGGLEQGLDSGRCEHGKLGAGDTQSVLEVARDFIAGKPGEVVSHDDALVERFMESHRQPPAQLGQSDQEQAQPILSIHFVIGE